MRCQICNDAMGRPTRVELRGRESSLHLRLCTSCREALATDPVATVGGDATDGDSVRSRSQ